MQAPKALREPFCTSAVGLGGRFQGGDTKGGGNGYDFANSVACTIQTTVVIRSLAHADKKRATGGACASAKRTHTSANGQHKKRRNAANDTNLDDLAMSEVSPLPESDTEFVAC